MGNATWKIMGTGGAILAGILASKLVDVLWEKAGQDAIDPESPEAPILKALSYAAVTGLAVGLARTLTTRKAADFYAKSAGHLPAEMQESNA